MFSINGGVGGGQSTLQQLIAQYGQSNDAANAAGQAQYKNLLGSVANTTNSIIGKHGLLNNAGQQAIYDTKQATQNQVGQANQSLVDRGIYNTSIAPSVVAGIQNRGQQSLNNINEQVAGQKAGYTMDLGKLNADSILSQQNVHPDMAMYMHLIQQLAQSQPQRQTMMSTMGSVNAANQPNTALNPNFGKGGGGGDVMVPNPGDTFFSGASGANSSFNNPGYSPGLMSAMPYAGGGFTSLDTRLKGPGGGYLSGTRDTSLDNIQY